ncbi:MAG: hypothetical protein Alpg2KO_23740 [Alphaproteobacteria bacterium]
MTRTLTAAIALAIALAATPAWAEGDTPDLRNMSPEDRRAYMQSLTPEQKEAMKAEREARFQERLEQMTPEQREKALARKAEMEKRRAEWEGLSEEERAAKRAEFEQRRSERTSGEEGGRRPGRGFGRRGGEDGQSASGGRGPGGDRPSREEMRALWESMSEEERAQMRERARAAREARGDDFGRRGPPPPRGGETGAE